uniref:Isoprenylcysteine carboxylmethyltransferase family protein n=1 Tax=Roseihalotalea indica TaxID=2867963 RepID=A0AA49GKU8_9BACT|nr:isoprenylcysteine carboxylmethyltransferase family protein [Tunicatimonas sp. TK19036]
MALLEEMKQQGNFLFKFRGILPFAILLPGWVLAFQHTMLSSSLTQGVGETSYPFVCLLVTLLGLLIRIYTVGHTPANTSGRNTKEQVADTLNTSGIYSVVRHPLYLGNFLMWLGVGMLTHSGWFIVVFALIYWIYYERIMFAEEQFLRAKFGEKYTAWADHTPAFIPDFRQWKSSTWPFSYKKVLKKEKNSVLYIFLVFFLFETIPRLWVDSVLIETDWVWISGVVVAVILYFTLKILRSRTLLLDEQGR